VRREWRYKRDEEGRPRRFIFHREALLWTLRRVGTRVAALVGPLLLLSIVGGVVRAITKTGGLPGWEHIVVWGLIVLIACSFWLLFAGAYYLYIALGGGVMDRDARRRYREERRARTGAGPSAYGRP